MSRGKRSQNKKKNIETLPRTQRWRKVANVWKHRPALLFGAWLFSFYTRARLSKSVVLFFIHGWARRRQLGNKGFGMEDEVSHKKLTELTLRGGFDRCLACCCSFGLLVCKKQKHQESILPLVFIYNVFYILGCPCNEYTKMVRHGQPNPLWSDGDIDEFFFPCPVWSVGQPFATVL